MAKLRKKSTSAHGLQFLMVQSADHVTPLTGATPTVTLSKDNGAFAAASGAVTEIGNGWYKLAGNATDTNTLGPLLLHAAAAGGDPCDAEFQIVAFDPDDPQALGLTGLPASGTASTPAQAATAVWAAATSSMTAANSIGQLLGLDANPVIWEGFAQTGSTTGDVMLDSSIAPFLGQLLGCRVTITRGTGAVGAATNPSEPKYVAGNGNGIYQDSSGFYHVSPSTPFAAIDATSYLVIERANRNVITINGVVVNSLPANGIGPAQLSPDLVAKLFVNLTSVGVTNPATIGQYNYAGIYPAQSGLPYYKHTSLDRWKWTDGSRWYNTSTGPGNLSDAGYFRTSVGATSVGPYTVVGSAAGIPAVTAHGNAVLNAFQPEVAFPAFFGAMAITAGGALTLASTQSFNNTGQASPLPTTNRTENVIQRSENVIQS